MITLMIKGYLTLNWLAGRSEFCSFNVSSTKSEALTLSQNGGGNKKN
ncbi:MAG: hypothetical protein HC916_09655 [Coleofasciculaceae cyanobacterium SM2_1_6]|nr:hypothetical protein [Coleofasciculaceae cyanobacterium SM2_1_6]